MFDKVNSEYILIKMISVVFKYYRPLLNNNDILYCKVYKSFFGIKANNGFKIIIVNK